LSVLDYISNKADIMSNSWGSVPSYTLAYPVIKRIRELAKSGGRRGKGIVFLWAAGNENCLINYNVNQDVPYNNGCSQKPDGSLEWVGVDTTQVFENNLVGIPGVMHIAALASTAKRSHYSNYGSGISLCAPTNNVHEYYRMQVKGLSITTTTGKAGNVTHSFGGTSSATPLIAGIAALVISANPDLTAFEVISILKKTASKDLNFEGYSKTPPASFDFDTSWDVSPVAPFDTGDFRDMGSKDGSWSPWFGYGRADAATAVAEALRLGLGSGVGDLVFQGSSFLDKSIPDNNTDGIKDEIICDKNFMIRSIKVHIDIQHTYIGDLCVSLISPSGKIVKLHDREGGSRNDIHTDYSILSVPDLYRFAGEQAEGAWILKVLDLASEDLGRLQNWSLELSGEVQTTTYVEDTPGIIIPDNSTGGIERTLTISESGQLKSIEVEIDITHSFIGDLSVELVSPDNTRVFLHNCTGGDTDNIIKTYTMSNTSNLQALQSVMINGVWKLKVSDHVNADEGKLNRWALKIVCI
jgi:subtilisin-like proprotein convertase family protein